MTRIMGRAMRKPAESDEDNLQREDIEERSKDSLTVLYHALRRGDHSAADNAKAVGEILGCMVDSARRGDIQSLMRWYRTCREIISKVDEGGEQWLRATKSK